MTQTTDFMEQIPFTLEDTHFFRNKLKRSLFLYLIGAFFLCLLFNASMNENIEISTFVIPVVCFPALFLAIYTFAFGRYVIDFSLKKKQVYTEPCRIGYSASADAGSDVPHIEIKNITKIDLDGWNQWVIGSGLTEDFQLYEVSVSKFSEVILTVRRL
jgi:hypothetical protein